MNSTQCKVYNYIVERISDKRYSIGSRIPTEMELAETLGANRMNVHKALNHLQAHGLLLRNKRGGTTVERMPSTFTIGEMKRKTGRFVAVLNPLPPKTAHIHWNKKIISAIKKELRTADLEMREENVAKLKTRTEISDKLEQLAQDGAIALLCISTEHLTSMLESHPEMFFQYHRDIFVYARDIINWSSFPYNVVSVDLFNEGVLAAEHAFTNGYEHVFFGMTDQLRNRAWPQARLSGVLCGLNRLSDNSIPLKEEILEHSIEELLSSIRDGKNVMLVAAADGIAVEYIEKIKSAIGKSPGRDYGLISFNDDSRFKKYNLTTIAPPLQDIGQQLGEMISQTARNKSNHISFIKIKSHLKPGKTS